MILFFQNFFADENQAKKYRFNVGKHDFIDRSLTATCHKYGSITIKKPHPNWKNDS